MNEVVTPNVAALADDRGNIRLAINAVLALDTFVGILWLRSRAGSGDDGHLRDALANESESYRLVRDAAFALKHGELLGKKPRLVRRADQVVAYEGIFDAAVFDRSAFDTEAVIWLETSDKSARPADQIAGEVLVFFNQVIERL
ncbi:MAG: hypothetical protein K5821_05460 [Nitrobacter sp.]|uniref:hypothetical protein n=1 Tax=Nitrobacter sp. TaxID=29420 RepID=UPI0026083EBE|nr:hypothetical protein [Nitrobacter sp.]MCV0385865.1 hypothetical protein [Nitrobacter sp.]